MTVAIGVGTLTRTTEEQDIVFIMAQMLDKYLSIEDDLKRLFHERREVTALCSTPLTVRLYARLIGFERRYASSEIICCDGKMAKQEMKE